jgi:biopolymer transport protein ExbB
VQRAWGTFGRLMEDGGPVMWVLLIFSIVALTVIIERGWVLYKARINVNEFLAKVRKALIVNRSIRDGVKICEQYQGPVASVMKAGLLKFGQPKEDVEKTIENAALYELGRLERRLVVLATTANVAPLIGFFGTVVGMMLSFDVLAEAGLTNPGAVAIGIKVALTTTAAGLFVAIPVQIASNFFVSKVSKFVRDIETSANMLLETFGELERSGVTPERAAAAGAAGASTDAASAARATGGRS